MNRQETMAKLALQKEENDMQIQLKREMAMLDAQIEQQKMKQDNAMKQEQAIANQQLKQFEQMTNNPELYERLQQESQVETLMASTQALSEQIAAIGDTVATLTNEVMKEEKEPEPKNIQLVYSDGSLKEAVLTKDDGTKVSVKVGRKGK